MSALSAIVLTSATLLSLGMADAAEVSQSEADRLSRTIEAYIGKAPAGATPFVVFTPEDGAYRVTVDLGRAISALAPAALSVETRPIDTVRLTPLDDGTYRVDVAGSEEMTYRLHGQTSTSRRTGVEGTGIFDPAIGFYRHFAETVAKYETESAHPMLGQSSTLREATITLEGKPGTAGTTDLSARIGALAHSLTYDVNDTHMPRLMRFPRFHVDVGLTGSETRYAVTSFKTGEFADLWRTLVAAGGPQAWQTHAGSLRTKLRALSPVAARIELGSSAREITVQTELGSGSARDVRLSTDIDTGVDGGIAERFAFTGLTIDSVRVPEAVRTLLPSDADIGIRTTGLDIAGALGVLIDNLDLSKPGLADGFDIRPVLGALMPATSLRYELPPSRLSNQLYAVAWQGHAEIRPQHTHVDALVSARGLDDVIKALGQVRMKGVPEAVIGLYAAKALAKEGPEGNLTWDIRFDEGIGLTVNGQQVGPKKKI